MDDSGWTHYSRPSTSWLVVLTSLLTQVSWEKKVIIEQARVYLRSLFTVKQSTPKLFFNPCCVTDDVRIIISF